MKVMTLWMAMAIMLTACMMHAKEKTTLNSGMDKKEMQGNISSETLDNATPDPKTKRYFVEAR